MAKQADGGDAIDGGSAEMPPLSKVVSYPEYRPNGMNHTSLGTPLGQRLQMLAVIIQVSSIVLLPWLYFILWTVPFFWPFLIYYTVFLYLLNHSPALGDRWSDRFRSCWIYRNFCKYFPISVHKTCDLEPTFQDRLVDERYLPAPFNLCPKWLQNSLVASGRVQPRTRKVTRPVRTGPRYIVGYHPHGVLALGATGVFASEGVGISKLFPGIRISLLTLVNQFVLPFYRDYIMALGVGLVTKRGIRTLLKQDRSVAIVIGGAAESLLAKPGMNSLILNRRKGFVKIALRMVGCSDHPLQDPDADDICLVPVYGFGENDIYNVYYTNEDDDGRDEDQSRTSRSWKKLLHLFQLSVKEHLGFTLPVVQSRSIFNYDFGLLPYRRPMNIVFGEPIPVKRLFGAKPGDPVLDKEVVHYHRLYVEAVKKLFADNKDRFLGPFDQDLRIVE